MTHERAGANWTAQGVVVLCSCGTWQSTAVPVGKGWMEDLEGQWEDHVRETTS